MPEIRTAARGRVLPAIVAAVGLLVPAGYALGEPALPLSPSDGAIADSLRPAFSWTAGSSGVPIAGYQVFVETPAGAVKVADAPAGSLSATAAADLTDDTRYRWFVRLTNTRGGIANTPVGARTWIEVATPPSAPTITDAPAGTIAAGGAAFAWTGGRVSSRWSVLDGTGATVGSGEVPLASGRAEIAPLPDGAYVFRVAQRSAVGLEGPAAERVFMVDLSAPPAPVPTASGSGVARATAPAFSWTAGGLGTLATWRVRGPAGAVVAGPFDTATATAAPGRLSAGAYVFEVRLTDAAGHVGEWGSEPFSITPSTSPALGGALSRARRAGAVSALRRNARRLSPAAGRTLATRHPALRWTAGPTGTTIYNVQLFRVGSSGRLAKVGSAFPTAARYIPPRAAPLAAGACYVWRVWPYRSGAYAPKPIGVSDFCVRPSVPGHKSRGGSRLHLNAIRGPRPPRYAGYRGGTAS